MEITSSHKGQTVKTANVKVPTGTTHDAAIAFAMQHFNETPASLMDWSSDYFPAESTIVVSLYTA